MPYGIKKYDYNDRLSREDNLLIDRLYRFKVSGMAEKFEAQQLNPNSNLEDFYTRFSEIVNYEWDMRQGNKLRKLTKKATLKYPDADFDESLYEPDRKLDTHTIELLAKCEWLDDTRNLLITGSAGAGKTYIANALCIAALQQMRTVKYIRASVFMNECEKRKLTVGTCYDYMKEMSEYDLLAIDDFGLMELDIEKCRHLFEVIETRDSRKPTMIISQFPVIKWWDFFADNTYADACLSRMTSKAYRLECNGRDMRAGK